MTEARIDFACAKHGVTEAATMISGPEGQPGEVRLMSMRTARSSTAMS